MKKYFFLIFLILITVFLTREYLVFQDTNFQIFAEKDYLLIRSESGKIWGYGNINFAGDEDLKKNITPYFSRENIRDIYDLIEEKEYSDGNLSWQKISSNSARLHVKNKTFLFFTENFNDQDREKLINSNLSLKADWHILNKNIVLGFLPNPSQGILYISERNPSKNLQTNSREKNISLISTKETGGFSLKFLKTNWQLRVRK